MQQFQTVLASKQKKEQVAKDRQGVQGISERIPEKTNNDQQSQDFCRFSATKDKESSQANKNTISEKEIHPNCQENKELMNCHLEIFKKVYSEVGPNWTKLLRILNEDHQVFLGSSTNQLKNLFCNSMRRLGKIFEKESWKFGRRSVKNGKNYLLSMLEIVNQAERVMVENGQKPNPQTAMQKFKSYALTLCLTRDEPDQQTVHQLIQVTGQLGKKMKCYGIFKVKDKRHWKATQQSLKKLACFSGMTLSDLKDHVDQSVDDLMLFDEPLNRSWIQRRTSHFDVQLKMLEEGSDIEESDDLNLMSDQNRADFIPF